MAVIFRTFHDGDELAFRALNETWIRHHFVLEASDVAQLSDPRGTILAGGGEVVLGVDEGTVVATCALVPHGEGTLELAKMTVAESARGRGLGRRVLEAAITEARRLGARRLYLESNSTLKDAVHLYEALGFRHLPERPASPYARADVFMELDL